MDIDFAAGRRIRTLRLVLGLSQADLGSRVGVSYQQIQKYESGKNRLSVEMLSKLGHALQKDPEKLLKEVLHDVAAESSLGLDKHQSSTTDVLSGIEDAGIRRAMNKLIQSLSLVRHEQN